MKDTPVGGQFRNYIERGIQIVKKKIRLMKKTVHGEKLPLLEKEEAELLVELARFEANNISYGIDEEKVYPNDIISPNIELETLNFTNSPLSNVEILFTSTRDVCRVG